jgi:hypothetical protein
MEAWDVNALISEEQSLLWPAQYWLNIDEETTIVQRVPWEIMHTDGGGRDERRTLSRFKRPWTRNLCTIHRLRDGD